MVSQWVRIDALNFISEVAFVDFTSEESNNTNVRTT